MHADANLLVLLCCLTLFLLIGFVLYKIAMDYHQRTRGKPNIKNISTLIGTKQSVCS